MRRTGDDGGPDDRRRLQRTVAVRDGALVVAGEIVPELPSPRPGVIWMPGEEPMHLGDADRQRGAGWAAAVM